MEFLRCRKIRELLPWYANGTLTGEERAAVERHLRRCRRCRAELAELRELRLKLNAALDGEEPSPGLLGETLELITARELLEARLLELIRPQPEGRAGKRLDFALFALGFSLGVAYERGRLPFEARLSALGLPLAEIKGRI